MLTKSPFVEVPKEQKTIIELLRHYGIEGRHLLRFYYKSKPTPENKNGKEGYRIIRPYMIIPNGKNLQLVGLPLTELSKPIEERQPGHYTISQLIERLKSDDFEVLEETFNNPGIRREKVDSTKGIPVHRFIYDDEDAEKVKAEWLRIKYV